MKAAQDWSFITKEPGLPKLKPQDNRIFHALTAAYSSGQQQEVFGASATIVQREKELCEMALEELRRVHQDGDKADPTLDLIKEHYQARLRIASEKENKLKSLADDSRKLNEDHKKKTQELAEVKRNLMESQSKLRELAKQTEKLIKKEEELRFIEESLRKELGNNKREMLNGLYEIVVELGGESAGATASTVIPVAKIEQAPEPAPTSNAGAGETSLSNPDRQSPPTLARDQEPQTVQPELKTTLTTSIQQAMPAMQAVAAKPANPTASSNPTVVLASLPTSPNGTLLQAPPLQKSNATTLEGLIDRAQRVKAFEPLKALFSRSLVKTSEGEAICEYFYPVQSSKENRHYVFNAPFTLLALLQVLQRDPTGFHSRLEMAAGDLLSRLDHGKSIGLEAALKGEFNRESLSQLLGLAWKPREAAFQEMAAKVIGRLESLGAMRSKSLEDQFAKWVG